MGDNRQKETCGCLQSPTHGTIFIRNFPAGASQNPDDAAKLTTSYSFPGGVAYATTVQVDVKDNLATETNVVIIQVHRKG